MASSVHGVILSYSIKKMLICCMLSSEDLNVCNVCSGTILLLKCPGVFNINLHTCV